MKSKSIRVLAKQIKSSNYEINSVLEKDLVNALSVQCEGERVIHSRFGVGSIVNILGPIKALVKFDERGHKEVYMSNLTSIGLLFKNESMKPH